MCRHGDRQYILAQRHTTTLINITLLLTPTVAIWVQLLKYPVADRVEQSFVIFDIRALTLSGVKNYK